MRPRPTVAATLALATSLAVCDASVNMEEPTTAATTASSRSSSTSTSTISTTATSATTTTTRAPAPTTTQPGPPEPVRSFATAQVLGDVLVAAETALADPDTPHEHFSGWAQAHQQAYRHLVANPERQDGVRRRIPRRLRTAFDLNVEAGAELRRLTEPQPALPDWRIVAPPPVDRLLRHYRATEAEFGVPWPVLAAIHLVETRFGRIRGDSHAGARGPMQFLPSTWETYGEGEITDVGDAIMAAGRYLAAHGAPDDLARALYAYNHSERYVAAILAHAEVMERYDHYLAVYHQWQVYYRTVDGDVLLEEGYGS